MGWYRPVSGSWECAAAPSAARCYSCVKSARGPRVGVPEGPAFATRLAGVRRKAEAGRFEHPRIDLGGDPAQAGHLLLPQAGM
jgi:hypothetical protein